MKHKQISSLCLFSGTGEVGILSCLGEDYFSQLRIMAFLDILY